MKQNNKIVEPMSYTYDQDSVTTINSNAILSIMSFLTQVIEKEPKVGVLLQYPEAVEKVNDDKGGLLQVKIKWENHNANSFFFTGVDEDGAVPMLTDTAFKANQILYSLTKLHEQNINNGIAKLQTEKNAEDVFRA